MSLKDTWKDRTNGEDIVDADDIKHVGDGKEWAGFTTGEVYLSMEFTAINNVSGVVITEIAGQSLSGLEIEDITPPSIIIDTDSSYLASGQLSVGLIDTNYPIPSARANDVVSGVVKVDFKVEYQQSADSWIVVENSKDFFVPEKIGNYRIVWSANDQYGNTTERILTFKVGKNLPDINVSFTESVGDVFVAF
jgi:hypothetical protein